MSATEPKPLQPNRGNAALVRTDRAPVEPASLRTTGGPCRRVQRPLRRPAGMLRTDVRRCDRTRQRPGTHPQTPAVQLHIHQRNPAATSQVPQRLPRLQPDSDGRKREAPTDYRYVPDDEMTQFMRIAQAYEHAVPCFSPSEIDLEQGDRVRIVGGQFSGVEGCCSASRAATAAG